MTDFYNEPETLEGRLNAQDTLNVFIDRVGDRYMYQNLDLYADNNKTYHIYVKDRNLEPIDLTGATCVLTVKDEKGGTTVIQKSTAVAGQGEIGAPDQGEAYFYIVPADTSALAYQQYVYDVKVTLANTKTYTVLEGIINLLQPVNV